MFFYILIISRQPGSKWALAQAKKHLADQYLVVGVLEEVDKFIRILDKTLPRIFKGAISAYSKGIYNYFSFCIMIL